MGVKQADIASDQVPLSLPKLLEELAGPGQSFHVLLSISVPFAAQVDNGSPAG